MKAFAAGWLAPVCLGCGTPEIECPCRLISREAVFLIARRNAGFAGRCRKITERCGFLRAVYARTGRCPPRIPRDRARHCRPSLLLISLANRVALFVVVGVAGG